MTITDLQKHIGKSATWFADLRKANPKLAEIVKLGWAAYCRGERVEIYKHKGKK